MIPRVFVSSTIRDLHHVRQAVRECLTELGYQAVMSDYGEVGYLPQATAADSCFREAEQCDLGILIVGKRYGDDHRDGCSVTHGEFRTLHGKKTPVITIIEKDLMIFKALRESNQANQIDFPGMDNATRTFAFLEEIAESAYNNGIHEFQQLSDVRLIVRQQFAHIFGMLLRERFDPMRGDIRDILASVAALREELVTQRNEPEQMRFLRGSRELLEDGMQHYKAFLVRFTGSFDLAVTAILNNPNFASLVVAEGRELEVNAVEFICGQGAFEKLGLDSSSHFSLGFGDRYECGYGISDSKIYISESAFDLFTKNHARVRTAAKL